MAFFKKPFVAVILSVLLVILSTAVTVNSKLGNECRHVTDGFYSGDLSTGMTEESMYSELNLICALADDLSFLASNYNADATSVDDARESLQSALTYSHKDISYIYYTYDELVRTFKALSNTLANTDMSQQDLSTLDDMSEKLAAAQVVIRSSGYNDSVSEFLRDYKRFPTYQLGELVGVDVPEYFA